MNRYFVTATGTDVGKTLVSAILVEAMGGDYWKPIQAGALDDTDTMLVARLLSDPHATCHPESYRLSTAMSPHGAAAIDGDSIHPAGMRVPDTDRPLFIEGAGGLMVPLNERGDLLIDLIGTFEARVVLISRNYLGSINHTLLSMEALKRRGIKVAGLVFNGPEHSSTESFIEWYTGVPVIGRVREEPFWDRQTVASYAARFNLAPLEEKAL